MRQSLRHSCRTELTRQGISLPSDRQGYSRRLLGFCKIALLFWFILQHWAGVRLYTSYLNFAESCVFSKQSLPSLFSYYVSPPYPEVTELFCRVPSTVFFHYLSIFNSSTCVSFNTLSKITLFLVLLSKRPQ